MVQADTSRVVVVELLTGRPTRPGLGLRGAQRGAQPAPRMLAPPSPVGGLSRREESARTVLHLGSELSKVRVRVWEVCSCPLEGRFTALGSMGARSPESTDPCPCCPWPSTFMKSTYLHPFGPSRDPGQHIIVRGQSMTRRDRSPPTPSAGRDNPCASG